MKVALDTTYILGRRAVKDTYNLLADGIVKLVHALSEVERSDLDEWAAARGYERYVGGSVKGQACIDWDDKNARATLLGGIVGDADRLLELSRRTQGLFDEDSTGPVYSTIEIYGRPGIRPIDIPSWHVSLKRPVGDGLPAAWGAAGYSMFGAEIFNSDIRYDGDEVHIEVEGSDGA